MPRYWSSNNGFNHTQNTLQWYHRLDITVYPIPYSYSSQESPTAFSGWGFYVDVWMTEHTPFTMSTSVDTIVWHSLSKCSIQHGIVLSELYHLMCCLSQNTGNLWWSLLLLINSSPPLNKNLILYYMDNDIHMWAPNITQLYRKSLYGLAF